MMNKILIIGLGLALPLLAWGAGPQAPATKEKQYSPRGEAVYTIVNKWGPYVQEAYKIDLAGWAKEMAPVFAKVPLQNLQKATAAKSFDSMNDTLLGISSKAAVTPKSLGSVSKDLVFVPIPPCRILDTRVAGGIISAGATRGIDVTAVSDYAFQGGAANNCSGMGGAGSFAAVAINLTSVTPAQTGYFTAFPTGTTAPLAATQVYTAGGVQTSLAIVQLDQGAAANEMNIFSERELHLVGDVVGYFIAPVEPPLACVEKISTQINIAAGGVGTTSTAACDAGYMIVSGGCTSSSFDGRVVSSRSFADTNTHFCAFRNEGAGSSTSTAYSRCCRVGWGG